MIHKITYIFGIGLIIIQSVLAQESMDISGKWYVQLDTTNEMLIECQQEKITNGIIDLPASLAEGGYGCKTAGSYVGMLTPAYEYVGKAWYSREIEIPKNWEGKNIELFLERVLWESTVFIDGKEMSRKDALGTPHIHPIGKLPPGRHQMVIQVDNEMIHNIGDKGHAYGNYTQSIWNGIVGKMEMVAHDPVRISSLKVFPDISEVMVNLRLTINSEAYTKANIQLEISTLTSGEVLISKKDRLTIGEGNYEKSYDLPALGKLKKWSEFEPEVYVLKASIRTASYQDEMKVEFGFLEVHHDGTKLLLNGKPVFLRGNLDCVHFPLTGYPSCDIEDWERIFRIYKEYGLNHVRFHSWCPPDAAFQAASRLGIYIQAEASIWIDWWMSEDMRERGRPEMDTKGHPKGLGYDQNRDQFVVDEMGRMVDYYGNYPSFTMFCIGNELGNSDFDVMKKWVAELKEKDPRRLYAISTARKITGVDDYNATHYIQNIGRTRGLDGASTDWDFEKVYSKMNIPIVAHEIGQWPVYPRWSEIEKYSGVLKARNLLALKEIAQKNGIDNQDSDFAGASGALNQIMYKYEIESFLRTQSCAGVQLLSMQDYQGQGEALIGWLDAHWEDKGIATPEKFRQHYNTTVPLLRMNKFVWSSEETFTALAQLSHHGQESLEIPSKWKIVNEEGQAVASGRFDFKNVEPGSLTDLGNIHFDLEEIYIAQKLTVWIEIENTMFRNHWDFWVFPTPSEKLNYLDVFITDHLNFQVRDVLAKGGKVLLIANLLGTEENSVKALFYPLYWSLTFFPGQGKTCLGLLVQDKHPAFRKFPTSYHSDWQWETISQDARGFILNDLPRSFKPIAQPVDDFHRNNKVGSIFEFKVGKGSLLVCGYNLNSGLPVATQLKISLLDYMSSPLFEPAYRVDYAWLEQTMPALPVAEKADVQDAFEGAILYVIAGENLRGKEQQSPWRKELDQVTISHDASYELKTGGIVAEGSKSAWHGKDMEVEITCPSGIEGTLYVHLDDWDNMGSSGTIDFEGRKVRIEKTVMGGQWLQFHVMREDSNDGKLNLKSHVVTGQDLMINKLVLVSE